MFNQRFLSVLALALLAAAGGFVLSGCEDDDDNGTIPTPEASISVSDQVADPPDEVMVDEVTSIGPGWVVIHEQSKQPGAVIGFTSVPDGTSEDVFVELDRDAVNSETLYAMLHVDEGEVGVYEFPGDDVPAEDLDGEIVVEPFEVTVTAVGPYVTPEDQTLDDLSTMVVIAETNLEAGGWVVIHEDEAGGPGPVIGHAAIDAGVDQDVMVALERPAVDGETLHAMLHIDEGVEGTYEFPGPDEPVVDEGEVVVAPFVVTVAGGTPAVRLTVTNIGITAYDFLSAEPDIYSAVIGDEAENQTLTLEDGWRYEIINQTYVAHPFEFLILGAAPGEDVVLLSQQVDAALEAEATVDWVDDEEMMRFTVSEEFSSQVTGYRCALHVDTMRGEILIP
ncbi:MAG: hypothetical protein GF355_02485 [Candidatus Eisenbacteria bacterium]|nr:hypothetical protein [Candidatus Eisenbacteria bacterium]